MFGLLHHNLIEGLFQASENTPPIIEQLYLFMKRFHTQPTEFYGIPRPTRLQLYRMEAKVVEYENKKADEIENKRNFEAKEQG